MRKYLLQKNLWTKHRIDDNYDQLITNYVLLLYPLVDASLNIAKMVTDC